MTGRGGLVLLDLRAGPLGLDGRTAARPHGRTARRLADALGLHHRAPGTALRIETPRGHSVIRAAVSMIRHETASDQLALAVARLPSLVENPGRTRFHTADRPLRGTVCSEHQPSC